MEKYTKDIYEKISKIYDYLKIMNTHINFLADRVKEIELNSSPLGSEKENGK